MIGTLDRSSREVTVVGAGVAGLLAAHRLDKQGFNVSLLEAKAKAGGLIATAHTEFGLSESAAHSFLATPRVTELCSELQVSLLPVNRAGRARYVLRNGRARRFPLTLLEACSVLRRALLARGVAGESTMEEWALRHLGPAARDYLIAPFLLGIHAAAPDEISVEAAFPALKTTQGRTLLASLLRRDRANARPVMMTPALGMGAFVEALEGQLVQRLGSRFRRGFQVTELPEVANLVLALPADGAALLLREHDGELATRLAQLEYTPMVSVTVFISRADLDMPLEGVGVLIPKQEGRRVLGVLFNSSAFAGRVRDEGVVSFTVMLGGTLQRDCVDLPDAEIERIVCEELDGLVGLNAAPLQLHVHRWRRALPRYSRDLSQLWALARQGWCARPGRILFGNYTGQLSIRGMIESSAGLTQGPCSSPP